MAREAERVRYLWCAGHAASEAGSPDLARHMLFAMRSASASASIRLADTASRRICPWCSSLLIPGQTCTLRLVKKRSKGKATASGQGPRGGEESAHGNGDGNGNDGGGGCRGVEKRGVVVSRTWWDGFNKGRHSNAKNEMVCTCGTCGRKLCYGGSDVGVCANMRGVRGRERRSERFRDRERAEKQMRLEKASAFIQSEGLSKAKDGKKKARGEHVDGNAGGILPATMSERAEASIVSSYTSHAINSYRSQYGDRGVVGAGAGVGVGVGAAASPVAVLNSAALGSKQQAGDASGGAAVGGKRGLEAGGEEGKKKKKKKRESLESIAAAQGGGTTAGLGGGGAGGAGGGASGAAGGGPGQKKSLYDLMQGILGGP